MNSYDLKDRHTQRQVLIQTHTYTRRLITYIHPDLRGDRHHLITLSSLASSAPRERLGAIFTPSQTLNYTSQIPNSNLFTSEKSGKIVN